MPKQSLKPFSIAGRLNHCPECGATGDYKLLKSRAAEVAAAWAAFQQHPLRERSKTRLDASIKALGEAIDKEET